MVAEVEAEMVAGASKDGKPKGRMVVRQDRKMVAKATEGGGAE